MYPPGNKFPFRCVDSIWPAGGCTAGVCGRPRVPRRFLLMTQYCLGTIVCALASTLPATPLAQNFARGSIGGAVYDTSGGILPDARLTLTSEYGVRETKAGPDGTYRFASLEPGKHTLKAAYPNFKTTEIKDIEVRLNERTNIEVRLEAEASSQTITVTETAGGIDTTSTTSGGTITADLFKTTPVGRNITDIPYLNAGVNDGLGTGRANPSISGAKIGRAHV